MPKESKRTALQFLSVLLVIAAIAVGLPSPASADETEKFKAANAALERGDLKAAVAELDKLANDATLSAEGRLAVLSNRGRAHIGLGNSDAAIVDFRTMATLAPNAADAWLTLGVIYQDRRQYREALQNFQTALRVALDIPTPTPLPITAYNNLAWVLATCPLENCRDGKTAVAHILRSFEILKKFPDVDKAIIAGHSDTLAAAYAETGDYARAVEVQKQAIAMAQVHFPEARKEFEERLVSYEAKKPWRMPAP